MNILLLSPWFPSPPFGGALIRIYQTLRYLSRRHRVTLVAPLTRPRDPEHLAVLTAVCEAVVAVPVSETVRAVLGRLALGLIRGMPFIQSLHRDAGMARHLRRLTTATSYDIIHVEHSFMAPYLASVRRHGQARTVLSMHNIESLRFRRELPTAPWGARRVALAADRLLFGSWERKSLQPFDGIVTVSRAEEEWVRAHAPRVPVAVVPNGVDTAHFSPAPFQAPPRTIVFTGLMNYPPNIDAVVWFCDAILPVIHERRRDVRFLIVGDRPTPEVLALARRRHVEVTGPVPDVRPYLAESVAMVVPLRSGAGTRLKILEAMAIGRPVVSTRLGAEGLEVTDGIDILLGDSPRTIADHLVALAEHAELRARIASAGRRLVESTYDWETCFRGLDLLYEAVTATVDRRRRPVEELAS